MRSCLICPVKLVAAPSGEQPEGSAPVAALNAQLSILELEEPSNTPTYSRVAAVFDASPLGDPDSDAAVVQLPSKVPPAPASGHVAT